MRDLLAGAVAGALATGPMTVTMTALRRRLPDARRQAIPPRQITRSIAAKTGVARALDAEQESAATYGAHLGYGASVGAVYPAFAARVPAPPLVAGPLFGLAVWAGSYLGWLPAAGILRSAAREPAGRNAMMIAAHLVFGAATALVYEATRERARGAATPEDGAKRAAEGSASEAGEGGASAAEAAATAEERADTAAASWPA